MSKFRIIKKAESKNIFIIKYEALNKVNVRTIKDNIKIIQEPINKSIVKYFENNVSKKKSQD